MTVRTFKGRTTAEALRSIKGELGADAVIIETRTLESGGVEVEATSGHPLFSRPRSPPANPAFRLRHSVVQASTPPVPDLARELEPVRALLRGFLREADVARRHGFPPLAAPAFLALCEAGVPESLARQLALDAAGEPGVLSESDVRRVARKLIAARTPCAGGIVAGDGERRVVAFVGPTGVGKTSVLSKVAAIASLRDQKRVGLISADATRLGAIEQVRRYADVLGIPFGIALSREGLREALLSMQGLDLVLIDTGGRSPRDDAELDALAALLERPPCRIERHLCLSANAKEKDNMAAAERFRGGGYQRLLFTKLDETTTFGGLYATVRTARRPVSYLTRAPHSPEDLVPAAPEEIAELVLPSEGDDDDAAR